MLAYSVNASRGVAEKIGRQHQIALGGRDHARALQMLHACESICGFDCERGLQHAGGDPLRWPVTRLARVNPAHAS